MSSLGDVISHFKLETLYITTWHRILTSHNVNRAVGSLALLHNTPMCGVLGVDHVLTKYISVWFGNT